MADNLRHAQYGTDGAQIDDPQSIFPAKREGVFGEYGDLKGRTLGLSASWKPWGLRAVSINSSLDQTRLLKFVAESDFFAARVSYFHYSAALTQLKFACAATETADISTQANLAHPIVGGVAYNVIDSTANIYGWKTLTFNGAATVTASGLGTNTAPNISPEIITSDWVPVPSVPRADGGIGKLLMVMCRPINAATQNACWINATGAANMRTASAANKGRLIQMSRNATDAIATPGVGTFSLVIDGLPLQVDLMHSKPAATVVFIGDSTFQNQALVADNFSYWGMRACAQASLAGAPILPVNMGASGSGSLEFLREGLKWSGLFTPDAAVYETFTPNDPPYTTEANLIVAIQNMRGRMYRFLDVCRRSRIRPILTTGLPYKAGITTAALDNIRKAFAAEVRQLCATAGIALIDSDYLLSDGAAVANIKAEYNFGDDIHPNEAGLDLLGTYASGVIKNALSFSS